MGIIKSNYWRTNKISIDEHGIILITPTEDVEHELEDLIEFTEFIQDFANHKLHFTITDLRNFHFKVSNEATNYAMNNLDVINSIGGNAFLIKSLPNRLTINFVNNIYSPPYPFRAFGEYITAHKWLLKLKKKVQVI